MHHEVREGLALRVLRWLKTFFVAFLLLSGLELRLLISPHGTQIKKIDAGIIFTCVVDNYSTGGTADVAASDAQQQQQQQQLPVTAEMRWVGPDQQYVTGAKGSRYVVLTSIQFSK